MTSTPSIRIRAMTAGDLGFAMEVKGAAGWNQIEADWRANLTLDPAGCFVAERDGAPAGTAVVSNYGDRFGWVGMVLVHPEHRRRGVGTALLEAACDYARDQGISRVRLDASPAGRQVYLALGFVDEYDLTRYRGAVPDMGSTPPLFDTSTGHRPHRIGPDDTELVSAISDLDAAQLGAYRGPVLEELLTRPGSQGFYIRDGASPSGFVMTRPGSCAAQLGPLVADDPATAEALLRAALAGLRDKHVIMDVPAPNVPATSLAEHYGLAAERPFTRMSLPRGDTTPGEHVRTFGTAGADRG